MPSTRDRDDVSRAIIQLIKDGNLDSLSKAINELRSDEIAAQYRRLPKKRHELFLEVLEKDPLINMLRFLTKNEQLRVLDLVGPIRSKEILDSMKTENLSFLLSDLSDKKVEKLIVSMREEEKKIIRQHRKFPKGSAGRIMTKRYVWVDRSYTVEQTIHKLKQFDEYAHHLNYVYVVNDDRQLVGVVSYRHLLLSEGQTAVEQIMETSVVKVYDTAVQSDVAKMIGRFDFVSLPVVNEENILVGIIRSDEVLSLVVREANKDIEMLFASGKSIDFHTKPLTAAYRRLPWLVLLLFIGLVSGSIISKFEETLQAVVALAFFMPMIAGMTGNTGTQSLAVVVRGLASEDMNLKKSLHLVFRELIVGILLGVVCGVLISVIAFVWQGSFTLGLVVGSSLIITLIIGTFAGTVIPLILNRLKIDPAVASGPLITTINDILSLLIYFGIATMFISKLM